MEITGKETSLRTGSRPWANRLIWVGAALVFLLLMAVAAPGRYAMLAADVYGYGETLPAQGLSFHAFALYFTAIELITGVSFVLIAGLIAWRKGSDRLAFLVALTFAFLGVLLPLLDGLVYLFPATQLLVILLRVLVYTGLFAIMCLFPDGRLVPAWSRWYLLAWALFVIFFWPSVSAALANMAIIPETRTLADGLVLLVAAGWAMAGLYFQFIRYRQVSTAEQRQQTKWVLYGLLLLVGSSLINALLLIMFPPLRENARANLLFTLSMGTLLMVAGAGLSLTVAVAILRHRLWDIDILINRTLVYGSLTLLTMGIYVLLVAGIGSRLQTDGSSALALIATGLVAVLFQPLRVRLQTGVNRLMYGRRDDPVGLLSQLARSLEAADAPERILPTLVETIAGALKLPYVSIALPDGTGRWLPAASFTTCARRHWANWDWLSVYANWPRAIATS